MIKEGTKVLIEGIPYKIVSATAGSLGRHVLVIVHDTSTGTELRQSMEALMGRLEDAIEGSSSDRFAISKAIIHWFIDEKLKSGINTGQILAIKAKPATAESQIRRLLKQGADVEEIIEVLAFTITDKFWSGILNTSINTIAIPRQDGITLYEKIKSKMIAERHATLTEVHQATEEEMIGVEVVE
jgi:hypothetical protein